MKRSRRAPRVLPKLDTISRDTPLRLDVAARLAFPDGSMTASGLRRERDKDRLVIERVAGKDYTTLASIERMRVLCRVQPKELGSGSVQQNKIQTGPSAKDQCGSSEMDRARLARAALERSVKERSKGSANTSPKSINQTETAVDIRLKSSSWTC